jgi:hypothetical protein
MPAVAVLFIGGMHALKRVGQIHGNVNKITGEKNMSIFAGISEAQVFESSRYLTPGMYSVRLTRLVQGTKRIGKIPYVVVEFKVLNTNAEGWREGETGSWYVGFDKDAAQGNIKAFLAVANGCDHSEIDQAGAEVCFSDRSPLLGAELDVEAYNKPTKDGRPFTRVKWSPKGTLGL